MDIYRLDAAKGKKTETPNPALKRGAAVTEQNSLISSGSPVISISDFLEKVKTLPLANEVFSKDVSEKLGIKRTEGSLTGDIRYALPDSQTESGLSRGQRAKYVANNTQMRQYSRTDAAATIDSIVDAIGFGDQTFWMKAGLSGKSRSEVISYLFEKLNTTKEGYRAGVALC